MLFKMRFPLGLCAGNGPQLERKKIFKGIFYVEKSSESFNIMSNTIQQKHALKLLIMSRTSKRGSSRSNGSLHLSLFFFKMCRDVLISRPEANLTAAFQVISQPKR